MLVFLLQKLHRFRLKLHMPVLTGGRCADLAGLFNLLLGSVLNLTIVFAISRCVMGCCLWRFLREPWMLTSYKI